MMPATTCLGNNCSGLGGLGDGCVGSRLWQTAALDHGGLFRRLRILNEWIAVSACAIVAPHRARSRGLGRHLGGLADHATLLFVPQLLLLLPLLQRLATGVGGTGAGSDSIITSRSIVPCVQPYAAQLACREVLSGVGSTGMLGAVWVTDGAAATMGKLSSEAKPIICTGPLPFSSAVVVVVSSVRGCQSRRGMHACTHRRPRDRPGCGAG